MNAAKPRRQEINLYGLEFHRADQAFSFQQICRLCLVFFVALMLLEGFTAWTMWSKEKHLQQLNAAYQDVNTRLNRLKQAQPLSQRPKLELELSKLQQQIQQRRELQQIMGGQKFGNFDGFSPFLVSLARRANADMTLTQIHLLDGGKELQLQGWARVPEAVPRYLQNLRTEDSFEGVRFGVLHIEKDPQHSHKLKFELGNIRDKST
jgi:MSHA biogenesis protein MshI